MSFLIDTNIILEVRKGGRCDLSASAWWSGVAEDDLWLSPLGQDECDSTGTGHRCALSRDGQSLRPDPRDAQRGGRCGAKRGRPEFVRSL